MSVRRFVQASDGELIEVGPDYVPIERASNRYVGDSHYDGLRASDGADISTRTKHREYMRRTGLATVDDFGGHFKAEAARRERFFREGHDPTRRPQIERAVSEAFQRARGKR